MHEDLVQMAREQDVKIYFLKSAGRPKYFARVVKPGSRVGSRQYHYFYSQDEYDTYLRRKAGLKVQSPPVFKSIIVRIGNWLFKAQLGMFGEEQEVQRPGSRGGRFYYTESGKVVYGTKPVKKLKKPEPKEQYELLRQPGETIHELSVPEQKKKYPLTQKERELSFIQEMAKKGKLPKGAEKLVFKKPTPSKQRIEREERKWETGLFSPGRKQTGLFEQPIKKQEKQKESKFIEISELEPGDKVRFIPHDKEFADEIIGTIEETINENTGVHIFNPTEKDPYNVQRVWGRNGRFELLEKYKKEEKPAEKKKEESNQPKVKNRLDANPGELAADYKARGMDRQRAWSEFVKDRALKPEMDAKDFYKIYDNISSSLFEPDVKLKEQSSEKKKVVSEKGKGKGEQEFEASSSGIDKKIASASHLGTSFDPEKRAQQEIEDFREEVQSIYDKLKQNATGDDQKKLLKEEMERFQAAYAQKKNELLSAKGRIVNPMIAGPSNFPTRQMEKRNKSYDNKYVEISDWKKRAISTIEKKLKGQATEEAGGELVQLEQKINQAEKLQEHMKSANTIVRKKISDEDKIKEIVKIGLSEKVAREILKPDYAGNIGFPSFKLTNNNANIKRMKQRLEELKKREGKSGQENIASFKGAKIINNNDDQRIQIFFDQKPSSEIVNDLKRNGWHWSPSNKAWQRKNTDAAVYDSKRIIEKHFEKSLR